MIEDEERVYAVPPEERVYRVPAQRASAASSPAAPPSPPPVMPEPVSAGLSVGTEPQDAAGALILRHLLPGGN